MVPAPSSLPPVCAFPALLEIALHRFREPGTKYRIFDFELLPMSPKDYTYAFGWINLTAAFRGANGDKKDQLRCVTSAIQRCLQYYLYNPDNANLRKPFIEFLENSFVPGLFSLRSVYINTCLLDTIQIWEDTIGEGLRAARCRDEYHQANAFKAVELDNFEHRLLDESTLKSINEIFCKVTRAVSCANYNAQENDGILGQFKPIQDKLIKNYREQRLIGFVPRTNSVEIHALLDNNFFGEPPSNK